MCSSERFSIDFFICFGLLKRRMFSRITTWMFLNCCRKSSLIFWLFCSWVSIFNYSNSFFSCSISIILFYTSYLSTIVICIFLCFFIYFCFSLLPINEPIVKPAVLPATPPETYPKMPPAVPPMAPSTTFKFPANPVFRLILIFLIRSIYSFYLIILYSSASLLICSYLWTSTNWPSGSSSPSGPSSWSNSITYP